MKRVKRIFYCMTIILGVITATAFFAKTSSASVTEENQAEINACKSEIKQANKEIKKLKRKYTLQKKARKKAMKIYKKSLKKSEGKAILFAEVLNQNPLIVHSNYVLCPIKGYYRVTNGSAFGGSFTGTIRLTGGYYNYHGIQCANATVIETQSYRNLRKVTKIERKMRAIKRQISSKRKEIAKNKKTIKSLNILMNNDISITGIESGLVIGETKSYDVEWKSEDAMCDIEWKVSDSSLAEIQKGSRWMVKIKALAEGEVTLTAKLTDSGYKKKFTLKIYPQVTDIVLQDKISMVPGEEKEIGAKCMPENAKQEIAARSWDSSIAQVEGTKIKAISGGVTKVIVTSGKVQKEIVIKVQNCIVNMVLSGGNTDEIKKDLSNNNNFTTYSKLKIEEGDYDGTDVVMNMFRAEEINQNGKFMTMWFDTKTEAGGGPAIENVQCISSDSSVVKPVVVNSYIENEDESSSHGVYLVLELVQEGEAVITLKTTKGITLEYTITVYDSNAD